MLSRPSRCQVIISAYSSGLPARWSACPVAPQQGRCCTCGWVSSHSPAQACIHRPVAFALRLCTCLHDRPSSLLIAYCSGLLKCPKASMPMKVVGLPENELWHGTKPSGAMGINLREACEAIQGQNFDALFWPSISSLDPSLLVSPTNSSNLDIKHVIGCHHAKSYCLYIIKNVISKPSNFESLSFGRVRLGLSNSSHLQAGDSSVGLLF